MRNIFLLIPILLSVMGCNALFYHPSQKEYYHSARMRIQSEDHYFRLKDSTKIHGRLFKTDSIESVKGLFVLFHGNAQNLTAHFMQFAWVLPRGYDLFVFDYPGYGLSGGIPTRDNTLESGVAALDFVLDSLVLKQSGKLILVGESLGGAILPWAYSQSRIRGHADRLILESTFHSYRSVSHDVLKRHWFTWPLRPFVPLVVSNKGTVTDRIPLLAPTPLLVATCIEDPVVNPKFSEEIFALAKEPKTIWFQHGCGHIGAFKTTGARDSLIHWVERGG